MVKVICITLILREEKKLDGSCTSAEQGGPAWRGYSVDINRGTACC
jgi:hypothetical protein